MFYAKNTGLQRQSPIFRRDGIDKPPTLVIDPNVISEDGSVSLAEYKVSPDAKLLAYGLSEGGADWETIQRPRPRHRARIWPTRFAGCASPDLSWTKDAKGFFYSRYPEPPKNKVLEAALVRPGALLPPRRHAAVAGRARSTSAGSAGWIINGSVTEDGRYLLITMFEGSDNKNRLYYADLGNPPAPNIDAAVKPIVETRRCGVRADRQPADRVVFLRSDKDAPNRRVIAVDLQNPTPVGVEDDRARSSRRRSKTCRRDRRPHRRALSRRRAEPAPAVRARRQLTQGEVTLPGIGAVGALSGREDAPERLVHASARRWRRRRCIATTRDEARARRSSRRRCRSTRAASRRRRCSPRRRTARACRSS